MGQHEAFIIVDNMIRLMASASGSSGGYNGDADWGRRHDPPLTGVLVGGKEPSGCNGSGIMEREPQRGSDDFGGRVACTGKCGSKWCGNKEQEERERVEGVGLVVGRAWRQIFVGAQC